MLQFLKFPLNAGFKREQFPINSHVKKSHFYTKINILRLVPHFFNFWVIVTFVSVFQKSIMFFRFFFSTSVSHLKRSAGLLIVTLIYLFIFLAVRHTETGPIPQSAQRSQLPQGQVRRVKW